MIDVWDADSQIVNRRGVFIDLSRSRDHVAARLLYTQGPRPFEDARYIGETREWPVGLEANSLAIPLRAKKGLREAVVTKRFYRVCNDVEFIWVEQSDDGLNFHRASGTYGIAAATFHK